jgi:hypothetical protein
MTDRAHPALAWLLVGGLLATAWLVWPSPQPLPSTAMVPWGPLAGAVAPRTPGSPGALEHGDRGGVEGSTAARVVPRPAIAPIPRSSAAVSLAPSIVPERSNEPHPVATAAVLDAVTLGHYVPLPSTSGGRVDGGAGKVRAAFVGAGDRVAHAGMSLAGAFRRTGAAFRRGF